MPSQDGLEERGELLACTAPVSASASSSAPFTSTFVPSRSDPHNSESTTSHGDASAHSSATYTRAGARPPSSSALATRFSTNTDIDSPAPAQLCNCLTDLRLSDTMLKRSRSLEDAPDTGQDDPLPTSSDPLPSGLDDDRAKRQRINLSAATMGEVLRRK